MQGMDGNRRSNIENLIKRNYIRPHSSRIDWILLTIQMHLSMLLGDKKQAFRLPKIHQKVVANMSIRLTELYD
jgi:hypothetical protein